MSKLGKNVASRKTETQPMSETIMFAIRTKTKNEPISKKQCIWVHDLPSPSDIGLISVSITKKAKYKNLFANLRQMIILYKK
jgi:hypothetical protein